MTAAKKKPRLWPVSQLQSVLVVLDGRTKIPTAELLSTIRGMVSDALAVMQEPDPTKRKVAFVLLAIQQSTEVAVRVARGKEITRMTVISLPLYHWALHEIHALPGAA